MDWPVSHARWLEESIGRGGLCAECPDTPWVQVTIDASAFDSNEAYRLDVYGGRVLLCAGGTAGRYYGLRTLSQWIGGRDWVEAVTIEDWPDFPVRGVMLDISRDKVPSQNTLCQIIPLLAGWKINQVQLYMEHTFAYEGHEVVWENASPMTASEIRALDQLCQLHHIELVPNQNSFGHMHRWLKHDAYKHLAEVPEGVEHAFSPEREPFGLCPSEPDCLTFLDGLYEQLLPCFSSRAFNVGLDETIDLGKGRTAEKCKALGTGRVYLEFVESIAALVHSRGFEMQCGRTLFWNTSL